MLSLCLLSSSHSCSFWLATLPDSKLGSYEERLLLLRNTGLVLKTSMFNCDSSEWYRDVASCANAT